MSDLLVMNAWIFAGLLAVAFVIGITKYFRGSSELWALLSQRFGMSTSDWPDKFPNESADCTLEALDDELVGWIFVREKGLMFRLPTLRKEINAILFLWKDVTDFRIESEAKYATFAINRKVGLPIEIRISWNLKLSDIAEKYRANESI